MIGSASFRGRHVVAFVAIFVFFHAFSLVPLGFSQEAAKSASADVTVGALLALTGKDKSFGITERRGLEIALDDINAAGGIDGHKLHVEFADTKLEEDLGLQEYKRLTSQLGIKAIVGVTGSGVALRLAPFATKDQVVLLSGLDTSPKLTKEGGPYFFRNIASDDYAGKVLSNWALERGQKTAAIVFNSENAWARGCKEAIEAAYNTAGGKWAVEPIAVLDSTDDFSPAILSMRNSKPQAIFVCLMGRQAGLFTSQAKSQNLETPFYGTDPFSQQEFIDNAKGALTQAYFVLPAESKDERYKKFAETHKKRFDAEADGISSKAYDALQVMAVALREASKAGPLSGSHIRDALAKASYDGITGPNAFDEHGDLKEARFDRLTYKDGKRTPVP